MILMHSLTSILKDLLGDGVFLERLSVDLLILNIFFLFFFCDYDIIINVLKKLIFLQLIIKAAAAGWACSEIIIKERFHLIIV